MMTPLKTLACIVLAVVLNGCAMVGVKTRDSGDYVSARRGDILSTGKLSGATREAIRVAALDESDCARPSADCIRALAGTAGLGDERLLAALAELWTQQLIAAPSIRTDGTVPPAGGAIRSDPRVDAALEAARHAYAYLFMTRRSPGERAFETRQSQVLDYYNYAVQEAAVGLFQLRRDALPDLSAYAALPYAGWRIHADMSGMLMPTVVTMPQELVPASSLAFAGLRSIYRRDGFGAELVAVMPQPPPAPPVDRRSLRLTGTPWSEMPSPAISVVLRFGGKDLAELLHTRDITLSVLDPYQTATVSIRGEEIPLAGNFTAGYGLWLARSGFAKQSLRTLIGKDAGVDQPHVFLMQPYDPNRRVLLLLHGLASSPEAWVNVANEVLGDETLRQNFQIWQLYYPTNMPIALNHAQIRQAVADTLHHFDPAGTAPASRDMVLIGHSMGGVIARLMVSSSQGAQWTDALRDYGVDAKRFAKANPDALAMFDFQALSNVERVIFIASPHKGTDVAGKGLVRFVTRLVRLPLTMLETADDILDGAAGASAGSAHIPTSIDNLDRNDPFIREAATLPMQPGLPFHSIIARRKPEVPLQQSDDGLVPYDSAHLQGAQSELVITSGHSVQETAPAVLEIRRILRDDVGSPVQQLPSIPDPHTSD